MTKQAMNYLLTQLEGLGYLQRTADKRLTLQHVTLTEKGWAVVQIQRATVRLIEQEWEAQIGRKRFSTFYSVLKVLTDAEALPNC